MPLVTIRYTPKIASFGDLTTIAHNLRDTVAKALSCSEPGGELHTRDVEIMALPIGPHDSVLGEFDVVITIDAHDKPSRRNNLEAISQSIAGAIVEWRAHKYIRRWAFTVWVRLFIGSFVSSQSVG